MHGTKEARVTKTRERLTDPANNGRLPLWQVALDIYKTRSTLHGTGAGTYQQFYPQYRTEESYVTDAHSLYLQSLSELGFVGVALIALVVGSMLFGLAARIRGPTGGSTRRCSRWCSRWALHRAVDWDWQMPAVTLPVFVLAGLALARPPNGNPGLPGLRGLPASRTLVALGWLVLAVAPLLVSTSYARLQQQRVTHCERENAGRPSTHGAVLAVGSGQAPQAYAIVGVCDLQLGFAPAAMAAMAKATEYEPRSWEDWLLAGERPRGRRPGPPRRDAPRACAEPAGAAATARSASLGPLPAQLGSARAGAAPERAALGEVLDHKPLEHPSRKSLEHLSEKRRFVRMGYRQAFSALTTRRRNAAQERRARARLGGHRAASARRAP